MIRQKLELGFLIRALQSDDEKEGDSQAEDALRAFDFMDDEEEDDEEDEDQDMEDEGDDEDDPSR